MYGPPEPDKEPLHRLPSAEGDDLSCNLSVGTTTAAPPPPPPPTSSARYKGVVLQQNGHWGAQIYTQHSRIWLGTFKSERAAARAYDSAAIKLRRSDTHRNFPWTEITVHEPGFQELFTTEALLEMIKDGSYEPKFAEFVRSFQSPNSGIAANSAAGDGSDVVCREMFLKELTPSDVGKLNRLVIPKKHATRFLPPVSSDAVEELLLEFRDRVNQTWVFRYCYWKSSQSYVFTKGWNKFVKEKGLRAKDTVGFYRCEERIGPRRSYCMIDVILRGGGSSGRRSLAEDAEDIEMGYSGDDDEEEVMSEPAVEVDEEEEKRKLKLFGVYIDIDQEMRKD
ncbi:AP2/ERF and B3 domain-containing transcription factor [Apostasia shenzhenica]|uniref:AP2/ERF and B3 domain-containing transcription factor n=1 Tax=Apostasia shenzhenica TaxID=1088818 RepID=A0A2I0ACI5_9ASPA|nr:AP2/ERF and B3 domain-containing transcription factor [Apostasia shenzhenica]